MSLGERLKKARKSKKFTQMDVANRTNITNYILCSFERNYRDPDEEQLRQLADLYEVSYEWLIGKSKNMYNNEKYDPKIDEDIMKFLENFKVEFKNSPLALSKDPLSEETKKTIIEYMENMIRQI